jgi:hypothetical protein
MKTNVAKTLTNFNKNSSSLRQWKVMSLYQFLLKFIKCFSEFSLHCLKLDELLLKFVKCFSDIILHCGKLGEFLLKFVNVLATVILRQWKLMSLKRWRTLIRIHQAYDNEN